MAAAPLTAPAPLPTASGVRRNVVANLLGRSWPTILGFLCVPVYVRILGIEGYGLVGFFAAMQAMFSLLDVGLSASLNRELARHSAKPGDPARERDLVRTLEMIYWALALVVGALIVAAAPSIALRWVQPERLSPGEIENAVRMMGLVLALQFPFTLYEGGLLGLQRQVALNLVIAAAGTLRFAGAAAVLVWWSPTLTAFFGAQLVASALLTMATAWLLWRSLPPASRASRFDRAALARVWRFAAGMLGISITAVILVQADKIVLSRLLSLEAFGYYALAATVAAGLYAIISPVFLAVFPRFSQLVALGDEAALRETYHRVAQTMSAALLPVAIVLALFSWDIVRLWTGSAAIAGEAALLVTLLAVGTGLNGLMNVPYALQLAHGQVRLTLVANVVAIAILVPLMIVLARRVGAAGVAATWVLLNAGYVTVVLALMHRRLLRGELGTWARRDVGAPLLAALAVAGAARLLLPPAPRPVLAELSLLATVLLLTGAAAAAAVPVGRELLGRRLTWKARSA